MIKYEIHGEEQEPLPIIHTVKLKLKDCSGDIRVVAVDDNGDTVDSGNLIAFRTDGTVGHIGCVSPELGFRLDKDGRIRTE